MESAPREAESVPMNMTPMIDIVFNLVTFFMLTLDLSHKELALLELPRAHSGIPEVPVAKTEERRLTVNLLPGGDATFRGREYPLASEDAGRAAAAIEGLKLAMISVARTDERLGRKGPLVVVVRGDRTVPWRRVAWVMQACSDPLLAPAVVRFAVDDPKDR